MDNWQNSFHNLGWNRETNLMNQNFCPKLIQSMLKVFKNCKHEWEAMLQTRFSNNQVSRTNRTNTNVQFSTIQSSKQTNASCSPGHHPADSYLKLSYTDKTSQYSEGKECSSFFSVIFSYHSGPRKKETSFNCNHLFQQTWGLVLVLNLWKYWVHVAIV